MISPPSTSRIEVVQVLRAIAALLVVVTHAINANDYRTDMPRSWFGSAGHFNEFGAVGVDLFFVISGFIMAHTLASRPQLGTGEFLRMRLVRVVPPFWLASLVFMPVAWLCGRSFAPLQYAEVATIFPLTMAEAYHMPLLSLGWTLAFELAFYCVVGLAIAATANPQRRLAATLQMTALLGLAGICAVPQWSITALLVNAIWLEFLAGLAVYWLWHRQRVVQTRIALSLFVLSLGLLLHSAIAGAGFADHPRALFWTDAALNPEGRSGFARALGWGIPCAGLLLGSLWLVQGRVRARLASSGAWQGLTRLGDSSYSLYLVHPLVLLPWQYLAPANRLNADLVIALLVALSCLLALLAHHKVEVPLLRQLRPLTSRAWGRPIAVKAGTSRLA